MNTASDQNAVESGQTHLHNTPIGPLSMRARLILLAAFLFLTLPFIEVAAMGVPGLSFLLAVSLGMRAVPLYLAWTVDAIFLDGGEVGPNLVPFLVLMTGAMLWPLPVLGVRPGLWASHGWRKGVAMYSVIAVVGTTVAACWVFTHLGIFF